MDRPVWSSWAWPAAWASLAVLALGSLTIGANAPLVALAPAVVAIAVTAWAFVQTRRERRRYERRLESWARERATQEERLRIARDLHDLASHGLGLITVRAATARLVDDSPGGEAERRAALADIERLGREATGELRRMLGVLRGPGERSAPLQPAARLADLPAIAAQAHRAGLVVDLSSDADESVPPGVQVAACAVVREGLANALRHAGPTRVRVTVRRSGASVVVRVRDDGPAPEWSPQPGAGHGLLGLRERVAVHGGSLTAGPLDRGFEVVASLPFEAAAGGEAASRGGRAMAEGERAAPGSRDAAAGSRP